MKKIRIGNDFSAQITLTTSGVELQINEELLDVVIVRPDRTRVSASVTSVDGGTIVFAVGHDLQTVVGIYRIELWLNKGDENQTIADKLGAFQLVAVSTQDTDESETVDLGELDVTFVAPFVVVEDNVESTSAYHALSANQGRLLNDSCAELAQGVAANAVVIAQNTAGVASNKANLDTLANTTADVVVAVDDLQSRMTEAEGDIVALNSNLDTLSDTVEETSTELAQAIDKLETRATSLEATSTKLEKALDEQGAEIDTIDATLSSTAKQVATNTANIATNTSAIAKNTADVATLSTAVTNVQAGLAGKLDADQLATATTNGAMSAEDKAFLDILRMGKTEGYLAAYEHSQLNPEPLETYGDTEFLKRYYPYLIDYTDNAGSYTTPVGRLQNNNWLRFVDGTWAPVVGINATQYACCMENAVYDSTGALVYEAGAFDAEAWYDTYGMAEAYDSEGNVMAHTLRPWETTSTDLGIYKSFADTNGDPCAVTLVDNVEGESGRIWRGILSEQASKMWDGVDVSRWRLAPTGFSPSPVALVSNKVRSYFYAYDGTSYCAGNKGNGALCSAFYQVGRTFPANGNVTQPNLMKYARANNADTTAPSPHAEGGYHAENTFLNAEELIYGTKYLHSQSLFSSGISANNSCNSESTWYQYGGVKWKLSDGTAYNYNAFSATPSGVYYTSAKKATNWSDLLNNYAPKMPTLEAQLAVSYAAERGIEAGTEFEFYGATWRYENVTGGTALLDGGMDARAYKQVDTTFTAYDANGAEIEVEAHVMLRVGLMNGMDVSGDIYAYTGGGHELVAVLDNKQTKSGSGAVQDCTITAYVQPDQTKWLYVTDYQHSDDSEFGFEGSYINAGTYVDSNVNGYVLEHQPYTLLPVKQSGSLSTGECSYFYGANYHTSVEGARSRVGSRLRGFAHFGDCSARNEIGHHTAGSTSRYYGGSALVLLGE